MARLESRGTAWASPLSHVTPSNQTGRPELSLQRPCSVPLPSPRKAHRQGLCWGTRRAPPALGDCPPCNPGVLGPGAGCRGVVGVEPQSPAPTRARLSLSLRCVMSGRAEEEASPTGRASWTWGARQEPGSLSSGQGSGQGSGDPQGNGGGQGQSRASSTPGQVRARHAVMPTATGPGGGRCQPGAVCVGDEAGPLALQVPDEVSQASPGVWTLAWLSLHMGPP